MRNKDIQHLLSFFIMLLLSVIEVKGAKIECFLADTEQPAPAVIVCPGGIYSWLGWEVEGVEVARWLQSEGISAFVLKYPVQGVFSYVTHYRYLFRGHQYPDAINELQEVIKDIRASDRKTMPETKRVSSRKRMTLLLVHPPE